MRLTTLSRLVLRCSAAGRFAAGGGMFDALESRLRNDGPAPAAADAAAPAGSSAPAGNPLRLPCPDCTIWLVT